MADAARSFVSHPLARCEAETWTTVQVKRKTWSLRSLTHDTESPEPEVSGPTQRVWNLEPLVHCNVEAEGLLGLLKQHNLEVLATRACHIENSGYLRSLESDQGRCALFLSHPLLRCSAETQTTV